MNTASYIGSVLQYIEENLLSEINPEGIADRHFISVRQLYRDFYSYTGHSIKQYIRKRRISNACGKIKCSDRPLSVIANESGCQTQQAFHKQFKSIVGQTPAEYRQNDTYFYFYPLSTEEISIAVKVGREEIPECSITRYYDSCLTGIEDKAVSSLEEKSGRVFGRNGKQIGSRFCYEIMTEKACAGIGRTCKFETYATCVVDYKERDINDGWNYLYNIWLPASMFELSGGGYFEEYLFRNGKHCRLKLYLAVKKSRTAQNITISKVPEMLFVTAGEKGKDAERKASERVINFLQENYPLIIQNARRFFVRKYDDCYECGIECAGYFELTENEGLGVLHIPRGEYAVLSDGCLGDAGVGKSKIDLWLTNNGIAHENEPVFAIYETLNGKFDADNISMKLYKRLKNGKNG